MKTTSKKSFIGVDLFAGAGGMSLGAQLAGIDVVLAVENDPHAAATYRRNHPKTRVLEQGVETLKSIDVPKDGRISVLFGGPPCQGFSTSNQRTRSKDNASNWLYKEFVRIVGLWKPDWVVFENVKGIIETANGWFKDMVIEDLESLGYTCSWDVLCAADYGVPQVRSRFFLIASKHGKCVSMPKSKSKNKRVSVKQALCDLPELENGANQDELPYASPARTHYAKLMRNGSRTSTGHLVTRNATHIIERYKHISQGENWESIPESLMNTYKDRSRCHTGIYRRLSEDRPSVVIGNYRKNMLIHPWSHRGLSVREAARLQSFPDSYLFSGSVGFQQQQVGNAVPPLLAKRVFEAVVTHEFKSTKIF